MSISMKERSVLKKVLKALNDSIKVISRLDRDPPITTVAFMQMNDELKFKDSSMIEKEIMAVFSGLNSYRRNYWRLEGRIGQQFLILLKGKGFLPGSSPEVESLKNSLPSEMIKGDARLWVYSFDHYIPVIAEKVGRPVEGASKGAEIWDRILTIHKKQITDLIDEANEVVPRLYHLKAKISTFITHDEKMWEDIKVKQPKVVPVQRPIRRSRIIKRPIPLPKRAKKPRKRILRKPKMETVGPEDFI